MIIYLMISINQRITIQENAFINVLFRNTQCIIIVIHRKPLKVSKQTRENHTYEEN